MKLLDKLIGLVSIKPLKSREEAIKAARDVAQDTILRDALLLQEATEKKMVEDKFALKLEQLNEGIKRDEALILQWAKDHREAEFEGKQTLILPGGHELAFHKGTGATKPQEGFTEKDALMALLSMEGEDADALKLELIDLDPSLNKKALGRIFRGTDQAKIQLLKEKLHLQFVVDEKLTFTPGRVEVPELSQTVTV